MLFNCLRGVFVLGFRGLLILGWRCFVVVLLFSARVKTAIEQRTNGKKRRSTRHDEWRDDRPLAADVGAQVARTLGPVHEVAARARIAKRAFVSVGTIVGRISDRVSITVVLIFATGPCTKARHAAEEALQNDG